uniref:Mitochondrial fission process protein 1 n=1 Tax=Arcella intermedia TaxID=1963864 RepID=A0A6B2LLG7_9EUKA
MRYVGYVGRTFLLLKRGIRYAAYTSDVGEALRYIIGTRAVQAAYLISWFYVAGDVGYETYKAKQAGAERSELWRTAISRAIFQSLASMILPAITIHTGVAYAIKGFNKVGKYQKWGPTMVGFAIIPFLPYMFDHPVEQGVEYAFDYVWPHPAHLTHQPHKPHQEPHKKEEI